MAAQRSSLDIQADVLVIGAGLIGSSVAMHLAERGVKNVRVIDFDLEGSLSSSELNAGGVRGTWTQPINIEASKISIDYFAKHALDVGYRACGYLWLHSPEKIAGAIKARETQTSMGWEVQAWDVAELRRKIPFIDKTDGLAGAMFAPRDGLVNPNLLKTHYRKLAREKGVAFDDRTLLRHAKISASGVTLECDRFIGEIAPESKAGMLARQEASLPREVVRYRVDRVVNCAGPWAPLVAQILGYPCPSHPVRRQVCIFDCRDVDLTAYGMIVDSSGVYFHPEATNGLAGFADPNEPSGVNYAYDGEKFFEEVVWPALYARSSKFERLRHMTGWAGLYEVSPDESAIIGKVQSGSAGRSGRFFECHSFSGHGAMHSYAAGLAMAEYMDLGRFKTWDAAPLSAARFDSGQLIRETLVI